MSFLSAFGALGGRAFSAHRLVVAALVTVVFTGTAQALRGVTKSGAVAGFSVCFLLYVSVGFSAFAALVSVFFLAWIATRFGRVRKQSFGLAERGEGRQASQVLANLGVAALCGIGYFALANFAWLLALVAALAEAAADTVSSEIGQAIGAEPRLVTTWRRVPPGTDGGVTVQGSLAGIAAAAIVVLVCVLTEMIPWRCFGIAVVAAIVGMLGDSFLGAWLERRGLLNNDGVNFLGTMIAAMVGWFFVH